MPKKNSWIDRLLYFVLPMMIIAILGVGVARLPWYLNRSWFGGECGLKTRLEMLGTFGDMFGFLNAMFSGIAFAALFYTLRIQQKQHDLQAEEVKLLKARGSLELDKENSEKILVTKAPGGPMVPGVKQKLFPAIYVRICLKNKKSKTAKDCRASLIGIKEKRGDVWEDLPQYQYSMRLRQSLEESFPPEYKGVDIAYNDPCWIDVFSIKNETKNLDGTENPKGGIVTLIQVANSYAKYDILANMLKHKHEYKFIISVVSENSDSLTVESVVKIGTEWNDVQVEADFKVETPVEQ